MRGGNKMFLDDKGRIFGKVSIIDIAVILFICAAIGGAYFKFFMTPQGQAAGQFDTLIYQVEVKTVRQPSVDAIIEGAAVYDGESGNPIGEIIKKEVIPAKGYIEKADGTVVQAMIPERYDMLITVKTHGVENDHGFFAGGIIELKRGSDLRLRSKRIEVHSRVFDIWGDENAAAPKEQETQPQEEDEFIRIEGVFNGGIDANSIEVETEAEGPRAYVLGEGVMEERYDEFLHLGDIIAIAYYEDEYNRRIIVEIEKTGERATSP